MPAVSIQYPIERKKVLVRIAAGSSNQVGKAILLAGTGEPLKRFLLTATENELALDEFEAGVYTLRIEKGNEVLVRQITLD